MSGRSGALKLEDRAKFKRLQDAADRVQMKVNYSYNYLQNLSAVEFVTQMEIVQLLLYILINELRNYINLNTYIINKLESAANTTFSLDISLLFLQR